MAWVKTADYWQDRPGQQSIRLNYDLLDRGVGIERIVILGWNLWLPEIHLPGNSIRRWLEEQHYRGISLALVRESDLVNEPDLLRDFGIYGTRATGEQELDEQSRTVRFELRFDEPGIRLADRPLGTAQTLRPTLQRTTGSRPRLVIRIRGTAIFATPELWRLLPGSILIRPGWA